MYSVTVSDWGVGDGVGVGGVDVRVAITTVEGGVRVGILITGVGGRGASVGQGVGVTKVIVGMAGMVGMAIRVGLMGREGHVGVGVGASVRCRQGNDRL